MRRFEFGVSVFLLYTKSDFNAGARQTERTTSVKNEVVKSREEWVQQGCSWCNEVRLLELAHCSNHIGLAQPSLLQVRMVQVEGTVVQWDQFD